jgi:hypothetical protein
MVGSYVYHKKLGYVGCVEGKTRSVEPEEPGQELWRYDRNYFQYRARLSDGSIRIAAPENLIALGNPHLMRELHRNLLARAGIEYQGVREDAGSRSYKHRRSHCWHCKKHLDTAVDMECVACGWMLCHCGACGCTYADRFYA